MCFVAAELHHSSIFRLSTSISLRHLLPSPKQELKHGISITSVGLSSLSSPFQPSSFWSSCTKLLISQLFLSSRSMTLLRIYPFWILDTLTSSTAMVCEEDLHLFVMECSRSFAPFARTFSSSGNSSFPPKGRRRHAVDGLRLVNPKE